MFVQHMSRPSRAAGGMVATVMPHGVLFRGGDERDIRTGLLDDDLLDAVIGLGPNLFYGTGIPACILVLRAHGHQTGGTGRARCCSSTPTPSSATGRAQNYLLPEHIEKIVSTYREFADIPGFARVVTREELGANDDNLNIRRYADNAPAARAARRARPPARRRAQGRGRRKGSAVHRARIFAPKDFFPARRCLP